MIKQIALGVISTGKDPYLLKHLKATIKANATWACDVQQTMMLIGYLTAPPNHASFHLPWAWLRYASAISPLPGLRLQPAWSEVDPHQKTILADDFGMGFSCQYLVQHFGFEAFANTNYVLDKVFPPGKGLKKAAANGAAKSPDFIAIDAKGDLHILD